MAVERRRHTVWFHDAKALPGEIAGDSLGS
jgi:hypothetical protein